MTKVTGTLEAKGITIRATLSSEGNDYISLTDIAKYQDPENPRFIIQNWMRNRSTVDFLRIWEELHNPDFTRLEFDTVTKDAGKTALS